MAEAPSPVQALFDSQINELLGSGAKSQEAAAGAVAGLYFIFLLITVYNVTRDRIWAHFYILLFTAGTCSFLLNKLGSYLTCNLEVRIIINAQTNSMCKVRAIGVQFARLALR